MANAVLHREAKRTGRGNKVSGKPETLSVGHWFNLVSQARTVHVHAPALAEKVRDGYRTTYDSDAPSFAGRCGGFALRRFQPCRQFFRGPRGTAVSVHPFQILTSRPTRRDIGLLNEFLKPLVFIGHLRNPFSHDLKAKISKADADAFAAAYELGMTSSNMRTRIHSPK
jgi:hypothetical protein